MSRAYFKGILREVRQSLGRFLAIFGIVALGVGFLAGLWATTPNMHLSLDNYFSEQHLADVLIKANRGFTDSDIAALQQLPQVDAILPAKVTDTLLDTNSGDRLTARIYGLPWQQLNGREPLPVNRWQLVAGRLPQSEQECLVEQSGSFLEPLALGTRLTLLPPVVEGEQELYAATEFTVVGVVANPFYFSKEREPSTAGKGRLEAVIYLSENCYELDLYTDVYLTSGAVTDLQAFSAAYDQQIAAWVEELEVLGESRSRLRYQEIVGEAQSQLDEAGAELATAEKEVAVELASAWQEISDARQELTTARQSLDKGQTDLEEARTTLAKGRAEAEIEISQAEQALAQVHQELEQGEQSLVAALEAGLIGPEQAAAMRQELDYGWQQHTAGAAALDEAKVNLAQEMLQAETELAQAALDLEQGEQDYAAGLRELTTGETAYWQAKAEAEQELAAAKVELAEAEQELADLAEPMWYVLDRNANVSYVSFSMNSEKVQAIATVFPVFFMLVAALVSLASMSRMVEEERTQIGIMKALGYSPLVIMEKYIGYCGLASLAGSVSGLLVGFRFLPAIIWQVFDGVYHLPPLSTPFRWPFAIVATLAAVLLTMLVTLYTCQRALAEKPALLMRPRAPQAGKRIWLERIQLIWSRLKFSHKATARNLFRYKKHFYMTIVGVAGCTALIVTGFGLRDSIASLAETQFSEIMRYDLLLNCQEGEGISGELAAALDSHPSLTAFTAVRSEAVSVRHADSQLEATLQVPQTTVFFSQFINLRQRQNGTALPLEEYPVVSSETLARALGLQPGDTFLLENGEGDTAELTLAAINENYVGSYLYLAPAAYRAAFGQEPLVNTLLATSQPLTSAEQDQLLSELLTLEAVTTAEFLTQMQQSFDHLIGAINFIVVVLIAAAGALAVIVLYNLININIEERNKELATLRVLGFHHEEVAGYIFRETAILSLIGALVGLPLGKLLHSFVVRQAESTDLMLGQRIAPSSFFISAVLTLGFAGLICLVMYRKLQQIKMVDSMKAIE